MSPRSNSKRLEIIAFAEANPHQASYLSAKELGTLLNVSESTVIRAVQAAGYAGYPDFQEKIRLELTKKRSTVERLTSYKDGALGTPLPRSMLKDSDNIKHTLDAVDPAAFDKAVQYLSTAQNVWLLGLRMAHSVAIIMHEGLSLIGVKASLLIPGLGDIWDEVSTMGEDDVLIAISLPRYTKMTIEAVRMARESGSTVITISDRTSSPLADHSTVVLPVTYELDGCIESFTPSIALAQALVVAVAEHRGEKSFITLKQKEELWATKGTYYEETPKKQRHGAKWTNNRH